MSARERFVQCALAQVGKGYRWATAGPQTFDCSGLVAFCYEQATGQAITRGSVEQFELGDAVEGLRADPGTVHFWDTFGNPPGHVAIDIGDGRVVHAFNEQRGVMISSLTANMGGPYMGARRLFDAEGAPLAGEPTGTPGGDAGPAAATGVRVPVPSTVTRKDRKRREQDRRRRGGRRGRR